MQVDAAEVGEEPLQDVLAILNGGQIVVGHDQSVQAGKHGAKLADFGPVLEAVVGDVKQAQGGASHTGGTHATVLIKAQEQLLQPAGQKQDKKGLKSLHTVTTPELLFHIIKLVLICSKVGRTSLGWTQD